MSPTQELHEIAVSTRALENMDIDAVAEQMARLIRHFLASLASADGEFERNMIREIHKDIFRDHWRQLTVLPIAPVHQDLFVEVFWSAVSQLCIDSDQAECTVSGNYPNLVLSIGYVGKKRREKFHV